METFLSGSPGYFFPQAAIVALLEGQAGFNSLTSRMIPHLGEFRRFVGGPTAMKRWMISRAVAAGAHSTGDRPISRIFCDSGKLASIQVEGHATPVSCEGLVIGVPYAAIRPLIHQTGPALIGGLKEPMVATHDCWTRFYTLAKDRVLDDFPDLLLVGQGMGAPVIRIETIPENELGLFGSDRFSIQVSTRISKKSEWIDSKNSDQIRSRIEREVGHWLPGFDAHAIRSWAPDFSREPAHWHESAELPGMTSTLGIEGLFAATDESFPTLGTLGAFRAAIEATTWIAHLKGLRGPVE